MKNKITMEARRFPVRIVSTDSGEVISDHIVLSKMQIQASKLVGESLQNLICRLYRRQGFAVVEIGEPEKKSLTIELTDLWEGC
mgnify:CR=1 FL=1